MRQRRRRWPRTRSLQPRRRRSSAAIYYPAIDNPALYEPQFMTWTSAFGKGSGWLLQKIVNGLALTKISPNVLTFIGLLINIIAAFFFGFARGSNANRMFLYAGLIIIGAGVFDMVDGRVARQTNQVSVFGAF